MGQPLRIAEVTERDQLLFKLKVLFSTVASDIVSHKTMQYEDAIGGLQYKYQDIVSAHEKAICANEYNLKDLNNKLQDARKLGHGDKILRYTTIIRERKAEIKKLEQLHESNMQALHKELDAYRKQALNYYSGVKLQERLKFLTTLFEDDEELVSDVAEVAPSLVQNDEDNNFINNSIENADVYIEKKLAFSDSVDCEDSVLKDRLLNQNKVSSSLRGELEGSSEIVSEKNKLSKEDLVQLNHSILKEFLSEECVAVASKRRKKDSLPVIENEDTLSSHYSFESFRFPVLSAIIPSSPKPNLIVDQPTPLKSLFNHSNLTIKNLKIEAKQDIMDVDCCEKEKVPLQAGDVVVKSNAINAVPITKYEINDFSKEKPTEIKQMAGTLTLKTKKIVKTSMRHFCYSVRNVIGTKDRISELYVYESFLYYESSEFIFVSKIPELIYFANGFYEEPTTRSIEPQLLSKDSTSIARYKRYTNFSADENTRNEVEVFIINSEVELFAVPHKDITKDNVVFTQFKTPYGEVEIKKRHIDIIRWQYLDEHYPIKIALKKDLTSLVILTKDGVNGIIFKLY